MVDLLQRLCDQRMLAIVRGNDAEAALRTVLILAEEGVELVEVSLTSANALGVIEQARQELVHQVALGAGTVLTAQDAARAAGAGAHYLVTPSLVDDDVFAGLGLPALVRLAQRSQSLSRPSLTAMPRGFGRRRARGRSRSVRSWEGRR